MVSKNQYTLTQSFMPGIEEDPTIHRQLERHRVRWERAHGPTDPTIRYSTMLDLRQQEHMIDESPEAYALSWPPYVQDFFRKYVARRYVNKGKMDNVLPECVKAYCAIVRARRGRA